MALRILTALASIFVLVGIALRNTPECQKTIKARDAIEIAFATVPKSASPAHQAVFASDAFLSKNVRKEKTENGWSTTPAKGQDFEGYFVQFEFRNDKYEGTARFDVDSCGKIIDSEIGAWLTKPASDRSLK